MLKIKISVISYARFHRGDNKALLEGHFES